MASLEGSRSGRVVLGANTLASGGNHESQLFGGTISGTGGLIETGSGVIPLSGENSHPGGTVNGTLMVAGHAALLRAGSTLQLATDQQGRFSSLLADSATLRGATLAVEAQASHHPLLRRYAVLSPVSGVSSPFDRTLLE